MKTITRCYAVNIKRRKHVHLRSKPRLYTLKRDKKILQRLKQGKAPKEVAYEMHLSSVWVVYDTIRRQRNLIYHK